MTTWAAEIEEDLRWREAELAALKMSCSSAAAGSIAQRSLLRALWAMLYAHYEGFYKFCWDLLLAQIELEKVDRSKLTEEFAKLSLAKPFRALRGDLSSDGIWSFVAKTMPTEMAGVATFPEKLETKSNLWPNVAQENNAKIEFVSGYLNANATMIRLLVSRRNEIAHGKKLIVSKLSDYQIYESAALVVMHDLALFVLHCLDKKQFLAGSAAAPAPVPVT
jgi:hypothetical protein